MGDRSTIGQELRNRIGFVATLLPLLAVAGCVRYRVVEIDTSKARQFDFSGKVRITERTLTLRPEFLHPGERFDVNCIELEGEDGRSVLIRPVEALRRDKPYACVQAVGAPPDQYLVPLRRQNPVFQRAWESMRMAETMPERFSADESTSETQADAVEEYVRIAPLIAKREFEQVSGAEVAFLAALGARQLESKYQLDGQTVVRVRIEDDSFLTVVVEDAHGKLLHEYAPEELAAVEVEAAGR
jgi:hypothetical protein